MNVGFSLIYDIGHSIECWIEFDIRYSTFDLNVGLSFDIQYSTFDLNVGFSLIFDIRHSKFECEIEFYIRYSTFDLNVGFSLIFDI